jgi:hypothetical protein
MLAYIPFHTFLFQKRETKQSMNSYEVEIIVIEKPKD